MKKNIFYTHLVLSTVLIGMSIIHNTKLVASESDQTDLDANVDIYVQREVDAAQKQEGFLKRIGNWIGRRRTENAYNMRDNRQSMKAIDRKLAIKDAQKAKRLYNNVEGCYKDAENKESQALENYVNLISTPLYKLIREERVMYSSMKEAYDALLRDVAIQIGYHDRKTNLRKSLRDLSSSNQAAPAA